MNLETNEGLLAEHQHLSAMLGIWEERIGRIEMELLRRMAQDRATEIVTDTHKATAKRSISYDQGKLQAVMEYVPEPELVEAGAYVPEHEETTTVIVLAKWNVAKLKPFGKRGKAVRDAIAAAQYLGAPRLSVATLEHGKGES